MARWRGDAAEASVCPPEGCFTLLIRLLQLCGLCRPHRYSGSFSGDADVPHADNPPQTQQLAGRSPERRSPERYALLPKGQQQAQEVSQGVEDTSQDETPKSGRTSPAPQYLKGARRSGKLGPSRNPSGIFYTNLSILPDPVQSAERLTGGSISAAASLISENEDFCSTCLEGYSAENPKIWTQCGHHFHLACIYEWLERKQTCPLCDIPMGFEEIL